MNKILVPFVDNYPQLDLIGFTNWTYYLKIEDSKKFFQSNDVFGYRLDVKIPRQLITSFYSEENLIIQRFHRMNMIKYNKPSYSLVHCYFSVKTPKFFKPELLVDRTSCLIDNVLQIVSTLV